MFKASIGFCFHGFIAGEVILFPSNFCSDNIFHFFHQEEGWAFKLFNNIN